MTDQHKPGRKAKRGVAPDRKAERAPANTESTAGATSPGTADTASAATGAGATDRQSATGERTSPETATTTAAGKPMESLGEGKRKDAPAEPASASTKPGKPGGNGDGKGTGTSPAEKTGRPRGSGAGILALLLVVVLAVACLAGGWWLWDRQESLAEAQSGLASTLELAELRNSMSSRAERLAGRVDNLAAEHQAHVGELARVESAMDGVRESQARMSSRMERIEALAAAHRQDWILSEVDYLFAIADQRLRFRRDVDGALAALRDADGLLARLGADTIDERRAVRRALEALIAVSVPDRAAIAAELGALIQAVDGWPVAQPETRIRPEPMEGQPDADLTTVEGWRQAGARAWNQFTGSLASLVVVRRDDPVPPLVSPEESWFLRENVRLRLQTARLALLEGEADTYRDSLELADHWLLRHFRTDDDDVAAARAAVRRLADVTIVPEVPDLSEMLPPVNGAQRGDG